MKGFRRFLERLAFLVLLVGGVGMFASMCLGVADVVGTQFKTPVPGVRELTEATMVLIVFGGLCYAQTRRSHIRVELVYTHMGPRVRTAMDVITHVMALVFFGLLLWQGIMEALQSWRIGETTVGLILFPLWPARFILVAGTALLMMQLVLNLVDDVRGERDSEGHDMSGPEGGLQASLAAVDKE